MSHSNEWSGQSWKTKQSFQRCMHVSYMGLYGRYMHSMPKGVTAQGPGLAIERHEKSDANTQDGSVEVADACSCDRILRSR